MTKNKTHIAKVRQVANTLSADGFEWEAVAAELKRMKIFNTKGKPYAPSAIAALCLNPPMTQRKASSQMTMGETATTTVVKTATNTSFASEDVMDVLTSNLRDNLKMKIVKSMVQTIG